MITKEDAVAFAKQLEELRKERVIGDEVVVKDLKKLLLDDRGPLDLTRRIDELEKENKSLKDKLDRLQRLMFDQFRNKGDL